MDTRYLQGKLRENIYGIKERNTVQDIEKYKGTVRK